jgi:general secretion pathway protein A
MYNQFFGFSEKPFALAASPKYLYLSKSHKAALTFLKYGLVDRSGLILMSGEVGAGKTTLCHYLLGKLKQLNALDVIEVPNTSLVEDTLVKAILQELNIQMEGEESSVTQVRILNEYLLRQQRRDKRVLLVLDEAQSLPDRTLEEIRMISNLQSGEDILLQMLLIGQNELRERIMEPSKTYLAQRIAVSCHLDSLGAAEARPYIEHRLAVAGHSDPPTLFTDEAVEAIHAAAGGVPRVMNILCNLSLIYAFADDKKTIDGRIAQEIIRDKAKDGILLSRSGKLLSQHTPARQEMDDLRERVDRLENHVRKLTRLLSESRGQGREPASTHTA